MGSLVETNQKTARRKGLTAAAVAGGSALLLTAAPVIGVIGLVGAGYLTYDWFMYRAKRGMRF
jgi:threonine/homoserine/homoserine lactone efflux protein